MKKFKTFLKNYKVYKITDGNGENTYDVLPKGTKLGKQKYGEHNSLREANKDRMYRAYFDFMEQFTAEQLAQKSVKILREGLQELATMEKQYG